MSALRTTTGTLRAMRRAGAVTPLHAPAAPSSFAAVGGSSSSSSSSRRAFSAAPRSALARMALIGRLAAQPELITTASGRELVRYAVGVNHGRPDNESTSWFRVANFDEGGKRDYVLNLPKGTLVHVDAEGRMRTVEETEVSPKRVELSLIQRSIEVLSRPRNAPTPPEE